MKNKSFVRELPPNYVQAKYINAKDAKLGIILNLIALGVLAVIMILAAAVLLIDGRNLFETERDVALAIITLPCFVVAMVAYILLHELVHGVAYKAMTGEKLTFGISWSCAFCGVPAVYTYRRTALIALVSPLIVFTLILIPLTVATYFVAPVCYLASAFILGLHLGGCSGDIYCTILFLFKFKDKNTLMRDTGPEQFFYVLERIDGDDIKS